MKEETYGQKTKLNTIARVEPYQPLPVRRGAPGTGRVPALSGGNHGWEAASTDSQRIKRIHRRVRKVRLSEEVGVKYMQAWEERYYEREEWKEEGAHNKLRELAIKKYHKGMSVEEIADWTEESPELIRQLLEEKPDPASGQEPGEIR